MTDTSIPPTLGDAGALVFSFFNEIGIIEQMSRTALERVLPDGMKAPHFGVLNHMARLGQDESPAELASAFQVSRPTMTNTIQRLEAKGYVTVAPNPNDGRGKIVRITPKGKAARDAAIEALAPLFAKIFKDLGPAPFTATVPTLASVRAYLDENR